jgi:TIR domain
VIEGFISYSHQDMNVCKALMAHLGAFSAIEFHVDQHNLAGKEYDNYINKWIEDSKIHILMISPYSIVSHAIMNWEIPAIKEKRARGDLVLALVVSDCRYQVVTGSVLASPLDKKLNLRPVKRWPRIDDGLHQACNEFAASIKGHFGINPHPQIVHWDKP